MVNVQPIGEELHGPRVCLLPLAARDLAAVRRWRSDPDVTRYWITQAVPTADELGDWLERTKPAGTLTWLIEDESGQPIG